MGLPEATGYTPVGIGPDGVVLDITYPSGEGAVLLAGRDGGVLQVPRLRSAAGVSAVDGSVSGFLRFDSSPCSGTVDPSDGTVGRGSCELAYRGLNPDGRWITATAIDADGYGDPSLLVLDAATGELQAGWSSRANPRADWTQHQWEDTDSLLATVVVGDRASIVRFGLDGSAERVVGPVHQEPYGDQVLVLPEG